MIKQPKYFVSGSKPVVAKTTGLVEPEHTNQAVLAQPPRVFRLASALHVSQKKLIICAGCALMSLAGIVAVNSGIVRAAGLGNLPVLFPRQTTATTVAAPGSGTQGLSFDIEKSDARVEIVRLFLERYKSPLKPAEHYAKELVAASDRYNLDYRLLPAIMMQESNLCKSSDPSLHNCLGFGIHSRGKLGFATYEEGFDRAARELKANYIDQGLTTPEQIMKKYTPGSNGSWAASVNQWIAEMEHNDREKGLGDYQDANLLEYTNTTQLKPKQE